MYYEKYTEPIFDRSGRGVGPTQEDRAGCRAAHTTTTGLIDINMETSESRLLSLFKKLDSRSFRRNSVEISSRNEGERFR